MKKLIAQLLAVMVLASSIALVSGCKKTEEPPPEPPSNEMPESGE